MDGCPTRTGTAREPGRRSSEPEAAWTPASLLGAPLQPLKINLPTRPRRESRDGLKDKQQEESEQESSTNNRNSHERTISDGVLSMTRRYLSCGYLRSSPPFSLPIKIFHLSCVFSPPISSLSLFCLFLLLHFLFPVLSFPLFPFWFTL